MQINLWIIYNLIIAKKTKNLLFLSLIIKEKTKNF